MKRRKVHYQKSDLLDFWEDVREIYHDKNRVKIFYGIDHTGTRTLFISLPGNFIESTVHFRECSGDSFFLPEISEYYSAYKLLKNYKIAWKWFRKRALTFEFGGHLLSWYFLGDGFSLNQNKL